MSYREGLHVTDLKSPPVADGWWKARHSSGATYQPLQAHTAYECWKLFLTPYGTYSDFRFEEIDGPGAAK